LRRAEKEGLLIIAVLLLVLTFILTWPLAILLKAPPGEWSFAALNLGLFAGLFVLLAGTVVTRLLLEARRFFNPHHALAAARKCHGATEVLWTLGPVSVHAFGADEVMPLVQECLETTYTRMEAIAAGPIDRERPLRILAFGRRDTYRALARRALLETGNLDGMFVPWPTRTILLTTDYPAYRLAEPDRVLGTLVGYFVLDACKGPSLPLWIQTGVAHLIGCGRDEADSDRLHRRLLASVARGTFLGVDELFATSRRTLLGLFKRWDDHACFAKYTALASQAWSVVEFLAGDDAPEDRRLAFRSFLRDLGPQNPQELVFQRHFGYGFAVLLDRWRAWMLERPITLPEPAPAELQNALRERLIPLIQDRRASTIERTQAIRDLGRAGYVDGADTLIDLLDTQDAVPRTEIVWALEAISGRPYGDDAARWRSWWAGLAPESLGYADRIPPKPSQGGVSLGDR
jgi:hypothetical protein